ncbi:hypothetical protein [Arthrobacter sp. ISL-95]|uniref:hypothetical protein n=1 Tax=Arthrobacter sp. ISL-95 TaxID=2819116 RepID=UPI002570C550|nr:hypothetical protein [Arthrobacter sp. ISL-95]
MSEAPGLATDEMVRGRDQIVEWQHCGKIKPSPRGAGYRNAINGADVCRSENHPVPADSPALWSKGSVHTSQMY